MKKFACLLVVAMMVLALGITAYARYELCPECEVALVTETHRTAKSVKCPVVSGKYDYWYYTWSVEECPECGEWLAQDLIAQEYKCGHTE